MGYSNGGRKEMSANQNLPCPSCNNKPYTTDTGKIGCHNPKCMLYEHYFLPKYWNSRPPHPLEKKVEEFRKYLRQTKLNLMNDDKVNALGITVDFIINFKSLFGDKE